MARTKSSIKNFFGALLSSTALIPIGAVPISLLASPKKVQAQTTYNVSNQAGFDAISDTLTDVDSVEFSNANAFVVESFDLNTLAALPDGVTFTIAQGNWRFSGAGTNGWNLNSDTGLTLAEGTSIDVGSGSAAITSSNLFSKNVTNNGTITGYISLSAGTNNVTNTGEINGNVNLGSGRDNLTNSGTINGSVNYGGEDDELNNSGDINGNVDFGSSSNHTSFNSGTITGTVSFGTGTDTFTNDGTVGNVNLGHLNDTFTLGTTGIVTGVVDAGNHLAADYLVLGSASDDADSEGTFDLESISNSGTYRNFESVSVAVGRWTLSGVGGGWSVGNNATLILSSGSQLSTITGGAGINAVVNSGAITGDITLADGNDSVTNSGTITGNVDLGSGVDTFTLGSIGSVSGIVTNENSNNRLVLGIEGDTSGSFDLATIGDGDGTTYRNFDYFLVAQGNWTLSGTGGDWNVGDDATLTLDEGAQLSSIAGSNGDNTVVNSGTITGNVDLNGGDDTVTNSGAITGDISLGDGDDSFTNSGTITGNVDGGAGIDSITTSYDASTTLDLDTLLPEIGVTFVSFEAVGLTSNTAGVVIGLNGSGSLLGTTTAAAEGRLEIGNIDTVLLNRGAVINTGSNTAIKTQAGTGDSSILIAGDLTGNVDLTERNATFGLGTQSTFNGTLAVGSNTPTLALGIDISYESGDALPDSGSYNLDNLASLISDSGSLSDIIVNAGTWTLSGSSDLSNVANGIKLNGNTNARLTLSEGATLGAGGNTDIIIASTDAASTVTREVSILGTLNGGASFGAGNDILTLGTGAAVEGNVDAQGGDADELRLGHADQSSNTGDFDLASIGAEAKYRNFENFSVDVGGWTFSGAGTNAWTLENDIDLTLEAAASINVGSSNTAITGGAGSNTITNLGSITGAVNLNDGDDEFILGAAGSIDGSLDGGGDSDALQLGVATDAESATGSLNLSNVSGFETQQILRGNWTFSGTGTNAWTLENDVDLTLEAAASIDVGSSNTAITGGTGNNTVSNSGTITGDVNLGDGDDTFNLGTGATVAGNVDAQDGADEFYLGYAGQTSDTGSFDLSSIATDGKYRNFENYTVAVGNWTLTGNGGDWNVGDDATLTLSSSSELSSITGSAGANTVSNSGTITGDVELGDGDDTYVIGNDGSITGSITGSVDGGGDSDTLQLGAEGDASGIFDQATIGSLATYRSFESFSVASGTWTLNGAGTNAWTLSDAAGLTLSDGASINVGSGVAAITGGTGANTVIHIGTITGDVNLGDGNDEFVIGVSASLNGDLDGGGGSDTLQLGLLSDADDATGSLNLSNVSGFESNRISGGSWTLSGAGTSGWVVRNGNTLTLAGDASINVGSSGATAIRGDSGTNTVSILGSVTGDVNLLGGNDTLTLEVDRSTNSPTNASGLNSYGTITGNVSLGDGDDTFVMASLGISEMSEVPIVVSGTVDGGDGENDALRLGVSGQQEIYIGYFNLSETVGSGAKYSNFENFYIDGASWYLNGDGINAWTINGDSELRLEADSSISVAAGSSAIIGDGNPNSVTNSGTITGNIVLGDGDDSLNNVGTLEGNVDLGIGDDTFRNTGTITGDVDLGDGDDTITSVGDISGTLDAGEGIDTIERTYSNNTTLDLSSFSSSGIEGVTGVEVLGISSSTINTGVINLAGSGTLLGTAEVAGEGQIKMVFVNNLILNRGAVINTGNRVAVLNNNNAPARFSIAGILTGNIDFTYSTTALALGTQSTFDGQLILDSDSERLDLGIVSSFDSGDTVEDAREFDLSRLTASDTDTNSLISGTGRIGNVRVTSGTWTLTGSTDLSNITSGIRLDSNTNARLILAEGATLGADGNTDTIITSTDETSTEARELAILGVLNGGASFGAGNDIFALGTGATVAGNVDAQGGSTDLLRLGHVDQSSDTGSFNLADIGDTAKYRNFEFIRLDVGNWTISGSSVLAWNVSDGTTLTLASGAEIGNVFGSTGASTIVNGSEITGSVDFGGGNDTFILESSGSVSGSVSGGAGSDTLRLGVEGDVDGDFNLSGIGASGTYSNFENFSVDAGNWTFSGAGTNGWTLSNGADLTLVEGASIDVGTSDAITGGAGINDVNNLGSITGNVNLGGGDDIFTLSTDATVSGNVDAQGGDADVLRLGHADQNSNTGSFNLSDIGADQKYRNFENFSVRTGDWTFSGAGTNAWTLSFSGSNLTLASDANLNVGEGLAAITGYANSDTVVNSGSITGNVNLGDGFDEFTLASSGSVAGVVDAGNSTDSLYLGVEGDTEGSFDLATIGSTATYRNFENYNVAVGNWTLSGAGTQTWSIGGGATLTLADGASINTGAGSSAILGSLDSNNTLTNLGAITGNVNLSGGDDTVTNSGTITGDVDLGVGNDTLTNSGNITGDINLGDGDDSFTNTGTITGNVDGGAGIDSITTSYDASTTLELDSLVPGGGSGTFINFEAVGLTSSAAGVVIDLNGSGSLLGTTAAAAEGRLEIGNIDTVILNTGAVINAGSNTAIKTQAGTGDSSILIAGSLTGNVDLSDRNATFGLGTASTFDGALIVGSNTPTLALGIDSSYGSGDALSDSGSYNLDNLASLISDGGSLSDIVVNAGTWTLTGSSDLSNVTSGIKLNGNTNARLTLSDGATLGAAANTDTIITSSDATSTEARQVEILGTLNGGASFGAGNDVFALGTGGSVAGNVDAQGGDADELRLGHADQSSNTGDFDLASIGAEAKYRNFENFSVDVGDWTFSGAGTNAWTLADGTSLTLAVGASIDVGTGAAITGTSGVNTVNNLGSITGNVNLDGGDDIFTLGTDATVSDNVDAQGGDADVLRLGHADQSSNTGSFNLSEIGADQKYRNFENFSVRAGDWTFSGAGTNAWALNNGASLTLASGASIDVGSGIAAITASDGNNTVTNSGTITGNVDLGSGVDTFTLGSSGSVSGIVTNENSNNRLELGTEGDTEGSFDLATIGSTATYRNFDYFLVAQGNWTLSGTGGDWNVGDDATLTLDEGAQLSSIAGSNGDNTVVNSGTISSNVDLFGGNDTLINSGNITGDIDLGIGDDSFTNTGTITGNVDGGDGIDSITTSYDASTTLELDSLVPGGGSGTFINFESVGLTSNTAGVVINLSGDESLANALGIGNIDTVILNRGAVINSGTNTAFRTLAGTGQSSILIAGSLTGNVDLTARNATFGLGTESAFNGTLAVGSNTPTLALGIDSSYEAGDALSDSGSYNLDNLASLISGSGSLSDIRVNAGTWTLTGSSDLSNVANGIKLNGNTSARLTLAEGATLGAGGNTDVIITSTDAASTVTREVSILGTLNGGVSFGAGNDTLILGSTGSVAGEVSGGAGSDTLELGSGLDADDVESNINLTNFVEFETNQINRGIWTFSGAGTSGWTLRNAADVTLASGASIDVGTGDAITGEAGANTVTNSGSITGNVNLGGGDDSLNLGTSGSITGAVSGGDGNDTLQLGVATDADDAEGNLNLTNFSNFETNQIARGNWTLSGDGTSSWTLIDDADVTLASGASIDVGSSNVAITGGAGANTVANLGSITGNVNLGVGDDEFTLASSGSVAGVVDAGNDIDSLLLGVEGDAEGSFDLATIGSTATYRNFENYNVAVGDWTLSGAGTQTWIIGGGATLTLAEGASINTGAGSSAILGSLDSNNTLTNLGAITGNVNLSGGDDTVTNSGTITGDVDLGVGNDTLTNSGNITGDISLGDGDDSFTNSGTITGNVDGGDGIDSITTSYDASTTLDLGTLSPGSGSGTFISFEAVGLTSSSAGVVIDLNGSGSLLGTTAAAAEGRLEIGNIDTVILNTGAVINAGSNTAIKTQAGTGDSSIFIAGNLTGNVDLSDRNATFGLGTASTFDGTLAVGSNTPTLALGIDSSYESGDALSDSGSYNLDNLASLISGSGSLSDIKVNAGTWTLTGSSDLSNVTSGIKLNGNTSARLTLAEGATLGADSNTDIIIASTDAASTVTREVSILGTLNGGVSFGAGNDILTLGTGGSVAGNVDAQGGDADELRLGHADQSSNTGDFDLASIGADAKYRNFENFSVDVGDWTFSGAGTNGWTLNNDTDVTLSSGASINVGSDVAAITGSAGANTVTNSGSITGNVNLGGGDDLLNLGTSGSIAGVVRGGTGNDTLQLGLDTDADDAEGNINLTNFSNFETNQITKGHWTFSGAGTNAWTLSDAAELRLASGASIDVGSDAIAIEGSAGINAVVNSGAITGDIVLADGDDSVTNSGTITGDINLGSNDDSVTNSGTITGAVTLGSGDDTFTVGSGSSVGSVNGGIGTDTLAFSNSGTSASPSQLNLSTINSTYNASGFEILNLSGGVTKLSGSYDAASGFEDLTVSSGATAVVDTLVSINGNFTTKDGSTLEIQVADSDDSRITTTGNYNLGSGSTFRINHKQGSGALVEGASFQVLESTATSGANSYTNANFESSSILYDFAIDTAATSDNIVNVRVENVLTSQSALTEFTSENPLIQETIDNIDSVLDDTSVQAQELRTAFFSTDVTDEQRLDALESFSPIETEQVIDALISTGQTTTTQLSNRTSNRLDSANNSDEYKLLASVKPVSLAKILLGDEFSVWGRGSVNLTDAGSSTGAVGYDATTYGLSIGADYKLDRDSLIGLGLNYSKADIKDGGVGTKSQKIDSYALSIYGGHRFSETSLGDVDIEGSLGYGVNTHNTTRKVAIGGVSQAASAKFNSSQFSAFVGASFPTQISDELVGSPRIGLNLIQTNVESYTETGSSYILNVGSLSHTSWIASGGYGFNNTIYGENSDVSINASLDLEFELGDINPQQTSNFVAGGDNIGSRNNTRSRTTAVINVGAQWQSLDGIDVGASYQGRYSSNYQDNGFFLNFRYKF